MKILESIVYVISQLILLVRREIAQEIGEILPNVSPKPLATFLENVMSFHQNCNTNHTNTMSGIVLV